MSSPATHPASRSEESGFLAIWSDVPSDWETDYLHWLTREHVFERLSIDGFLGVRVYRRCRSDINRFFIHYRLASPDVLTSEVYLRRLNAPSPWSRRIMPILENFVRGGGRVLAETGGGQGGVIVAVKLDHRADRIGGSVLERLAELDRIVTVRLLETDIDGTAVQTHEKAMRARDESFAGLVLIEGLDERSVQVAVRQESWPADDVYTEIFQL